MASEKWTTSSNEAIKIALVPPSSFNASDQITRAFNPSFTYQLFESETIYGYENLSVNLSFRQDDMSPSLDIKYSNRLNLEKGPDGIDDVEEVFRERLPEDTSSTLDVSDSTFTPPGKLVNQYTKDDKTFEIYHSNLSDPQTRQLIENMQILVLFFIEAANTLQLDDEEWTIDRWDVLFVYERLQGDQFSFIGYCTVHKFYFWRGGPAKLPDFHTLAELPAFPDEYRARISQFLILPPYQKQGHGRDLYDLIIRLYLENPQTKEITVEDPSEKFEDMRDARDFVRLRDLAIVSSENTEKLLEGKNSNKEYLTEKRAAVKMPQRQFDRMIEALLLEQILKFDSSKQAKLLERYTLCVKDRLYRHNKDVLMQIEKDERKVKLDETYSNVFEDYEKLLYRLGGGKGKGKAVARAVIAGKRPQSSISTIQEGEEEEEEEELEPPMKRTRISE
ncbi:hypothetical protein ABW19_dt0205481 [Dactylella cylindrospora]|nr:hypothetical protein ABW19_dt0205481 [Dactylella cylindrospora]